MEISRYLPVPGAVQTELIEAKAAADKEKARAS